MAQGGFVHVVIAIFSKIQYKTSKTINLDHIRTQKYES